MPSECRLMQVPLTPYTSIMHVQMHVSVYVPYYIVRFCIRIQHIEVHAL